MPAHPVPPLAPLVMLMAELLAQWGLRLPAGPAEEAYTVHFGAQVPVHVVHRAGERWVTVSCEAGVVSTMADARRLNALLALNRHDSMDPGATVALDPSSGTVVTWIRLPHAGLDSATLKRAVESVQRKVVAVRQVMDEGGARKAHADLVLRARLNGGHLNK